MKLIFLVFTVCTFVQSLSCDENYILSPLDAATHEDNTFFKSDFEYDLLQQFMGRKIAIVQSWMECKKAYNSVSKADSEEIFQNLEDRYRHVSHEAKCLADCTMRATGVVTDNGLNEAEYIMQIKQLRYNYTSFDINASDIKPEDKTWLMGVIERRASFLKAFNWPKDACKTTKQDIPYHNNPCNALIESYAEAARKCKNVQYPKGDACETSYRIMKCVSEENWKRNYAEAAFYPVRWYTLNKIFV